MNMRLLILSLIALLGLGSMGASGSIPPGQQKKLLDQQHQALVEEDLTLAQTYRQLMDQKRSLLEQLRALNPKKGTTQDWEDLWEGYYQYKVSDSEKGKDAYKDKLKGLRSKDVDEDAFENKVEALLKALEDVQEKQDALTQSWATHNQKAQQLDKDKDNFNNQ